MPVRATAPNPALGPPVIAGQLVSRALSTWWRRLWSFAAVTFTLVVPVVALDLVALRAERARTGDPRAHGVPVGLVVLHWLVILVLACALTSGAVSHLSRRPARIGRMLRAGFGRLLPEIGVASLAAVACAALALAMKAVAFVATFTSSGAVAIAFLAVGLVAAVVAGVSVTLPVVIAERAPPLAALRRSWVLTRGRRWPVLVALSEVGLLLAGFLVAELALVAIVSEAEWFWRGPAADTPLLFVIVSSSWLLLAPLACIAPAVAYHDLRLEKEGAPPEVLAQVFD